MIFAFILLGGLVGLGIGGLVDYLSSSNYQTALSVIGLCLGALTYFYLDTKSMEEADLNQDDHYRE